MSSSLLSTVLPTLMSELVEGRPDPGDRTYVLNRGDEGLLASLERLSAEQASTTNAGGASIAAHAEHLRYALSILNRWAAGTHPSEQQMDWTASWKRTAVSDEEWRALRSDLRREATAWTGALRDARPSDALEAGWITSSVVHLAYHLGAIRQIDRAARGPTAEDEARAEAALRER